MSKTNVARRFNAIFLHNFSLTVTSCAKVLWHSNCHYKNFVVGIKRVDCILPLSCRGQITLSKIDKICPLAIPNQIFFISMHVPSFFKIPWYLLKLSSWNENMGMLRAGNSVEIWRNLPIGNPKPDLHNINAHTKFGENPLMFTQVIIRKLYTDGLTDNWWTDGQTQTSNVKP